MLVGTGNLVSISWLRGCLRVQGLWGLSLTRGSFGQRALARLMLFLFWGRDTDL